MPTCQSAVCRSFIAEPLERVVGLVGAGRGSAPASEARVAHAGNGNCTTSGTGTSGWVTTIVPGLMIVARWRCAAGRNPYSPARRLGGVEPADDPDRRVGDDPPLDLARRLLGADEDDAERPAPLGDVEQDLLDRARPLPRRVLVELVEHDELQRPGLARALLALEGLAQDDADDEALGPVVEVVEVDDGDLGPVEVDGVARSGSGDVGPHEVLHVVDGAVQPADEGVDRARRRWPGRAHWSGPSGSTFSSMSSTSSRKVRTTWPSMLTPPSPAGTRLLEPGGHVVHDHRVLLAVVLGVGEQERQQPLAAELLDRPEERRDALVTRLATSGRGRGGRP